MRELAPLGAYSFEMSLGCGSLFEMCAYSRRALIHRLEIYHNRRYKIVHDFCSKSFNSCNLCLICILQTNNFSRINSTHTPGRLFEMCAYSR